MPSQVESYLSQTKKYWDKKASANLSGSEKVEWSPRAQRMRFESFLLAHQLNGKSILDIGCGTGDFLAHMRRRNIEARYVGFDLSPEMVRLCCEKYADVTFESGNFLEWDPQERFDYSISIGIHNVKIDGGREVLEQVTRRQFELSRIAAHVSLLTDRYQGFAPHIQAWRVEEIMELALDITPYVVVRHDYLPNDFSVTMYREPLIDTADGLMLGY